MIEITPHSASGDKKLDKKKGANASRSKEANFDQVLSGVIEKETDRGIDALMNDLRDQERRFLDTQSLYEMQKYKNMLQKILQMAVSDSFKTKTFDRNRRGSVERVAFSVIKQINDKVDELARIFASSDNKAFALMKTLEDIRGLLCDLVN
jgi:uncharacterized protein YaaR (DUF327 family)